MQISLKAARVNKGLTQAEVGKSVGVTPKTVGSWEKGDTMPKPDKIDPLCDLLGVKYDDIRWNI